MTRDWETYGTVGYVSVTSETTTAETVEEYADPVKPRLRGVLHAAMTLLVIAGGVALMIYSRSWGTRVASLIYMITGLQLFCFSAVYHLGRWRLRIDRTMQQIDHSNIFIFIAGTYTPLAIGLLHGANRIVLVSLIWACAALGVGLGMFALKTPRWVQAGLYVVMGWIALGWMPSFWMAGGPAPVIMLLIGGVVYTAGAVIYSKKKPNPSPAWFGFHEIFHACTVVAAICHWVAIYLAVR
jgi:hemolysin III